MSSHGGRRAGSGQKRIYNSRSSQRTAWIRGHQRMYIDHIIYSSWVSARIKCGFTTDSKFAGHLLSLEQRRR